MLAAIINDTGNRGHYGCDLVMARMRHLMTACGVGEGWSHPVGMDWRPDEILQRPRVDLAIVNGEGTIHNPTIRPRARRLVEFGPFAKGPLGIPAYLINATVTTIDDSAVADLRAYTGIYVRDRASQALLATYGISAEYLPDLTVGADIYRPITRNGVCVTDSALLNEVGAALPALAVARGWPYHVMDRRRAPRKWLSRFRRRWTYEDWARLLSSHDLIVTGRYHTVAMCIATRTPFVALEASTPKISWLCEDVFGSPRRVVSIDTLQKLRPADYAWTDDERSACEAAASLARTGASAMFATIAASTAATASSSPR